MRPTPAQLLNFLRRIVFKLVICHERYYLFNYGIIKAREPNLDCFEAEIKDITEDIKNVINLPNIYDHIREIKSKQDALEQQQKSSVDERTWRLMNAKQMTNDSLKKDILRKFCILKILWRELKKLDEIQYNQPEFTKYLFEEHTEVDEVKVKAPATVPLSDTEQLKTVSEVDIICS